MYNYYNLFLLLNWKKMKQISYNIKVDHGELKLQNIIYMRYEILNA